LQRLTAAATLVLAATFGILLDAGIVMAPHTLAQPEPTTPSLAAVTSPDPPIVAVESLTPDPPVVASWPRAIYAPDPPTPPPAVGSWLWPVLGSSYISQYFWSGHHAIDIAAPYGAPVVAAVSGTVIFADWRSYTGGGNVIWVEENGKLYTTYNHLSKWFVHAGQKISAGQRIGSIGTSGEATGPHLHFEVWTGYPLALGSVVDAVNPCNYLAGC
jgi:murein DD-endopeptidase MepM/ murein hydrolase activator NlpD